MDMEKEDQGPAGPNARRKARHDNVLHRLRCIIIKDKDRVQTQEGGGGLFRIPYKKAYLIVYDRIPGSISGRITRKMDLGDFVSKEGKDVKTGLWKGVAVEGAELRKFLDQVLSERPYVALSSEGMRKKKVVLGNLYINQGDFVYLNLREQASVFGGRGLVAAATEGGGKAENYFSLEGSENGDIWISTDGVEVVLPNSSILVSVNGDALVTSSLGRKRKLEFGDIITISTNKGEKEEEWERTDFLFMMPSQGQVINPISSGSTSSPLDNPLILPKVLSFLSIDEVKSARRVSHFWNEEAMRTMGKRTQEMSIRVFDRVDIGTGEVDEVRRMTVFNPLPEPLLKFPHWKVNLPARWDRERKRGVNYLLIGSNEERDLVTKFIECLYAQRIRVTDQKILDNLKGLFFGSQKRHVKILSLTVGADREAQLRMLEIMLGGVKDTLTALTLRLTFEEIDSRGDSMPISPSSLVELPCLAHLSLDLDINGRRPDLCFGQPILQGPSEVKRFLASFLLPAVGNIQSLTILHGSSSEALEEIAKMQDQEEPSTKFDRLSQVWIQESSDDVLKALSSLRNGSLRTLELGVICQAQYLDTAHLLRQTLERFSESLQELKLEFIGNPTLHINFPSRMRSLTSLSVFIFSDWMGDEPSHAYVYFGAPGQPGPNEEDDHQRMNDDIDYVRRFPSLVKLTVGQGQSYMQHDFGERRIGGTEENGWGTFLPFLSAFLPTQRRVPSITSLDIPFLLEGKYHPVLDNLEAIFPSVVFAPEEGLAQARGGPIWTQEDDDDEEEAELLSDADEGAADDEEVGESSNAN